MKIAFATAAAVSALLIAAGPVEAAPRTKFTAADWPVLGGDAGNQKYSRLTQLTPGNVAGLKKAWTYDTKDPSTGFRGWEVTPIVVNGVMYFFTTGKKIVALDADSGAEIWKYDLASTGVVKGSGAKYGVTYWPGDGRAAPRIVVATTDGYLLQLDAKTGKLFTGVGDKGFINLAAGVMDKFGGQYTPGATPVLYKNLAIFSPTTGEQGRYGVPGDPRAFDITTGKEVWRFHTVPQPGEENFGTWGMNGWQDRRGPGAWVPLTVDEANGIVYIALGNATDQNYGGSRPGSNLYATSVIALDAATGKRKWHFQITHHDIFDWDVNAPPTLIDVKRDGKVIPALAQSTKVGYLWILDRLTGEPIFGADEKPALGSDAPGETASPTQPIPRKPEPISRVEMTRKEVSALTPEGKKSCEAQYDKAVQAGPNTPYLMVPSLVFPSSEGGGSWGGTSYDPANGYVVVNTRSMGTMAVLQPTKSSNILDSYAKRKIPFNDPEGYPCSPGPWGELMAIDASSGDTVWRVPLGEYQELTARGVPKTGTPNAGGTIVTAGGLVFVGSTSDARFRAFDVKNGKELWSTEMPANAVNTPMTYQGKSGKQFVAIVTTNGLNEFNHPRLPSGGTNQLHVYALP